MNKFKFFGKIHCCRFYRRGIRNFTRMTTPTKPVKIVTDNGFPSEEESLASLINELAERREVSEVINVFQRDEIVFVSNFKQNELLSSIGLGQFVRLNRVVNAQCVGVKENLITFMVNKRVQLPGILESIEILENNEEFKLNSVMGKIVTPIDQEIDNSKLIVFLLFILDKM
jgi:hypothetical protein